ncbi:MAG: hypothetical protein KDG57_20035 [Rhodoferax sp.]|nr:hypothetical protein [Rhodoferax sp.]
MGVVTFPGRQQPGRDDLPEPLRAELAAIDAWLAVARRSLHDRPYAEREDHDALVVIVRRMRAALFTEWAEAQPRGRR